MALTPDGGSTASGSQQSAKSVDVVAVLKGDGGAQVFAAARPMRATVYERADLMEHPLEDGAVIADHRVQRPTEIDLPLFIPGGPDLKTVYAEIRQLWAAGTVLVVQTTAGTYGSMILTDIPHEEHPDAIHSITVGVRFREARFVKAAYGGLAKSKVKAKPKASTVKTGAKQTTAATAPQTAKAAETAKGSTLYRLTHKGK